MSTGVTCGVYVDGVRLPDGSPGDDLTGPLALSGLSMAWGRATTMDQPDTSTCTLEVSDATGGASFLDRLHTGARLDVVASGVAPPDPTVPAFEDPSFENGLRTWGVEPGTIAGLSTRRASAGTQSLAVRGDTGTRPLAVDLPPAHTGTDPAAWDALPITTAGQRWRVDLDVFAPPGAVVQVRAIEYVSPQGFYGVTVPLGTVTGDQRWAWQHLSVDYTPTQSGCWVGIRLTVNPTGLGWDAQPAAATWNTTDPTLTWDDQGTTFLDNVVILAPPGGTTRTVLVFAGRVTDLDVQSDGDGALCQVTAVDVAADVQNVNVGDQPWAAETVAARAARILALAAVPGMGTISIDPDLGAQVVSWRDVDSQGALGLLVELAQSTDGVLWAATHRTAGSYFVLEDVAARTPLRQLTMTGGVVGIVGAGADAVDLSACRLLRDTVHWTQTVSDVVTRVAASWLEQTSTGGQPGTLEHTEQVIDTGLEVTHGQRRVAVATQLVTAPAALDVAGRIMARTGAGVWRASGLTLDDALVDATPADVVTLLDLLDGTRRIGAPLLLTDLPGTWTPVQGDVGVYLEGGTYTFNAGAWVLALTVSNATGQGQSAAWNELDPTWTWNQWDPTLTWNDLIGAAVEGG